MSGIDDYLDELAGRLRLTPGSAHRLLEETESHLRDVAEAEAASGAEAAVAERRAIERFGTAREVARAANGGPLRVVGPGLNAAAQLLAIGCAVVIAGTLLAEALAWFTSTSWVFGQPMSHVASGGQIAHWLQVHPGAHDWRQAAAAENASDSFLFRTAAGIVGLVAALGLHLVGRRHARAGGGVPPAVGLTAFGGAAVLLVTGSLRTLDWGFGQSLCDAAVALLAAVVYAVVCARSVLVTSGRAAAAE